MSPAIPRATSWRACTRRCGRRIAIPVHGEARHLDGHARLAEECQVPQALVIENGADGAAGAGTGGDRGRGADRPPRSRRQAAGAARWRRAQAPPSHEPTTAARSRRSCSTATARLVADPQVTLHGLVDPEQDAELRRVAAAAVRSALEDLPAERRGDDAAVREAARLAVRRTLHTLRGKKPVTDVHLVRV